MEKIGGKKMNEQWTREEKETWNQKYYQSLDMSLKIYLAKLPPNRIPVLELETDENSWTNHAVIHIGTGDIFIRNEREMMAWSTFLLGHEIQHVLSTTEKSWEFGLERGFQKICEIFSRQIETPPRRFVKDADYDLFLMEIQKEGYHISKSALQEFVHFIVNSLEDGRIERIRCLKNPGYVNYIRLCRGQSWEEEPLPEKMKEKIDEPRVYLAVVLNQILTLATMSIYQKGFGTLAVEHIQIHRLLQKVIPHIRKAVSAKTCRACMEEAVEICGLLASEIIDACKLTPLEELLAQLNQQFPQNQSFPADSRTEQTGEGGESQLFSLFGSSDLTANQEQEQTQNTTVEQLKEADVHAAMKDADQASREEIGIFIKTGKREQPAKDEVTSSQEDVLPDLTSVQNTYNGMVTFTEKKRTYHPDQQMPVTLLARARNLKRKVEKIFKNRQGLSLRGQNKGKIDAASVYKLAMNRMDFFKRTQRSEPFEGCVYLLLDNSGSMGNGRMSKRNYCCGAAAVIEYAFSEHVLLKETAFTAYTDYMVEHTVIKDWHEHVSSNAAWNFYEKDSCASCNKDGYSIRVATKELLARVEKNKLLIVISDGLPSAYPGGREDGIEDVHAAVREARKAGIQVIAIYIQDDDNRREAEEFRQMYETNCITTQPEQIEAELVHILKRFCFR